VRQYSNNQIAHKIKQKQNNKTASPKEQGMPFYFCEIIPQANG
jgi:hypothetical protein